MLHVIFIGGVKAERLFRLIAAHQSVGANNLLVFRHRQGGVVNEQMIANSVETVGITKLRRLNAFPTRAHFIEKDAETQFLRGLNGLA